MSIKIPLNCAMFVFTASVIADISSIFRSSPVVVVECGLYRITCMHLWSIESINSDVTTCQLRGESKVS
jgi:hypothetical protein